MWELDHKKSWAQKNLCFWTVVLEKTLECPLDCNQIHPVHAKGDQSWVFIGRIDVEAETPKLWPPDSIEYTRLVYSIEHTNELEELTHSKRLWCWEILKGRRRRGWQKMRLLMASLTWWTGVWGSSESWWWTGKPDVLQPMGLQRVRHDWATKLN